MLKGEYLVLLSLGYDFEVIIPHPYLLPWTISPDFIIGRSITEATFININDNLSTLYLEMVHNFQSAFRYIISCDLHNDFVK